MSLLSFPPPHAPLLLHRDIKTQNVFVSAGGLLKLGDFGVSKILSSTWQVRGIVGGAGEARRGGGAYRGAQCGGGVGGAGGGEAGQGGHTELQRQWIIGGGMWIAGTRPLQKEARGAVVSPVYMALMNSGRDIFHLYLSLTPRFLDITFGP